MFFHFNLDTIVYNIFFYFCLFHHYFPIFQYDETEAVQKAVANNGSGFSVAHLRSQIAGFYAELRNTSQAERRALADTLPKMAAIIMRKCILYNTMCVPTGVMVLC